jgi:putative transposase
VSVLKDITSPYEPSLPLPPPFTLARFAGVVSISQPLSPLSRSPRHLPQGHSFHITLRCNSRQFLIAKGLRRDVLLAVLAKAQANQLHLLIRPDDASRLPKLMHWFGWYSAMVLTRLSGRCGHFWEARYDATAIAPIDHDCSTACGISTTTPKQLEKERGFTTLIPTTGYERLACDGISEWHPSFLQLASTLTGCSRRYEQFASGIAITPREQPSDTGAQGC